MICEIIEIGRFGKPHGINGEINALLDIDDPMSLSCIVVNIDGIDVPFFLNGARPKSNDAMLLKIDGYDSAEAVKMFSNRPIYALAIECEDADEPSDPDAEGFFASDFIGYDIYDTEGKEIGTITDIDDNTANVLFILHSPLRPTTLFIPVADEFIIGIDTEAKKLTMSLPQGIIDL